MEETCDIGGFVADRTEGKVEEGFFEITAAVEKKALVFEEGGLAGEGGLKGFVEIVPGGGPSIRIGFAERIGMFAGANETIAIVINLNVMRAPNQVDREVGAKTKADRGAQTWGPGFDGAQGCGGPVLRANELAHDAAAD
jgi:hypothetical protein